MKKTYHLSNKQTIIKKIRKALEGDRLNISYNPKVLRQFQFAIYQKKLFATWGHKTYWFEIRKGLEFSAISKKSNYIENNPKNKHLFKFSKQAPIFSIEEIMLEVSKIKH